MKSIIQILLILLTVRLAALNLFLNSIIFHQIKQTRKNQWKKKALRLL